MQSFKNPEILHRTQVIFEAPLKYCNYKCDFNMSDENTFSSLRLDKNLFVLARRRKTDRNDIITSYRYT